MANYLASITARTINAAPLVRPRLRGKFDPPEFPGQGSFDQTVVHRTFTGHPKEQTEIARDAGDEISTRSPKPRAGELKPQRSPLLDQGQTQEIDSRTMSGYDGDARQLRVPKLRNTIEMNQPAQAGSEHANVEAQTVESSFTPASKKLVASPIEVTTQISGAHTEREAISINPAIEPPSKIQPSKPPRIIEPAAAQFDPSMPTRHSISERVIKRETRTDVTLDKDSRVDGEITKSDTSASLSDVKPAPGESSPVAVVIKPRVEPLVSFRTGRAFIHQPEHEQRAESAVHVTIGRIEVRAVQQSSQPVAKSRATQPVMNLDDYLRRRSQGNKR
jgi:hypothetical protein